MPTNKVVLRWVWLNGVRATHRMIATSIYLDPIHLNHELVIATGT
jgi:hypothetical protein